MDENWQARTRQLSHQMAAITGRDLKLWVFTFVVVLILAVGVLLLGFSTFLWAGTSRSSLELAASLLLLVLIFAGYVFHRRHGYTRSREELIRELIYSEKVQSLSLIDPLTQTFNVCYLDQVMPREINRANRHGHTITFMLIEVAGWAKARNERGALVGDQMLLGAAQFLKNTFRGSDIVLRYGIKRFLIIMPETNEHQANCALQRMLDRLDPWHLESNTPFELDLRVGLAAYSRGADAHAVLKLAEKRLKPEQPPPAEEHFPGELARSRFEVHRGGREL
jgi:diguanylate cyclase (GGDEF)-like protein